MYEQGERVPRPFKRQAHPHAGTPRQQLHVLEENDRPVIGLREGSFIPCDERAAVLGGPFSARVFRRGHEPVEVPPQTDLFQFA